MRISKQKLQEMIEKVVKEKISENRSTGIPWQVLKDYRKARTELVDYVNGINHLSEVPALIKRLSPVLAKLAKNAYIAGTVAATTQESKQPTKNLGERLVKEAKMTKQHFQLIADVLNKTDAPEDVKMAFANALARTNPGFKKERFLAAAGSLEHTF